MRSILNKQRLEIELLHEEACIGFKLYAEIGGWSGIAIGPLSP